jgi:hypothetical protein
MGKKKKKSLKLFQGFRTSKKQPYKTIKIPLKSILKGKDKEPFLSSIDHLVRELNDLVIHSYQFIHLYLLYCFNNGQPLPTINDKFILYCIKTLGIKDNRGAKSKNLGLLGKLKSFYDSEYQPLLNHKPTSLKNKTHMIAYLATQIYTSLQNNIQERFIQHFLRFINLTTKHLDCDKSDLFHFKNQFFNLEEKDTNEIFEEWKKIHLLNILPQNIKKSVHYHLKVNPFEYLPGMLYMNRVLEKQGHKLFQPLPLRNNIIPKHIILDTACLIDYFMPAKDKQGNKIKKSELLKNIKKYQSKIWSRILNLKHKVFKNKYYQFNYQIQTDGFSSSLSFIRKDLVKDKKWGSKLPTVEEEDYYNLEELPKETLDTLKNRNFVDCDPGKHSLVYLADSKGNTLQYTAPQRRIESYAKRNSRILLHEKKKCKVIEKETKVSFQNSKSVDIEKFKIFLKEKNTLNQEVKDFYERSVWRKMGFRQYSYSKKSLDRFLNKIKEKFGENLLIDYGNWSRNTQMKGIIPTMNKGLRKAIHKKFDTVTVNECYTSQKCHKCYSPLNHCRDKRGKKIYRLFCCSKCVSSKNKNGVFRTRDKNSAMCIMKLTKEWVMNQRRFEEFKLQKRKMKPIF